MNITEYFKKYLKMNAWESIISAIIFLVIGILIISNPEGTVLVFSYIIGSIFALVGILKIVSYFIMKGNEDFFNYDIVFGIIAIIVGIILITKSSLLDAIFRIMVAIWVMYTGLIKATTSLKLKKYEVKTWWIISIIAILMMALGLYIISYKGILIATLGIFMVAYAIFDLINGIIFIIDINKYM